MNIKINFKKQVLNKSSENLILFVDENFNISSLKKSIPSSDYSYVNDLLKTSDFKEKILVSTNKYSPRIFLLNGNH